jgi:hypothetical protein
MRISSAIPSIVLPFLATVRFIADQSLASAIITNAPAAGVAGRLIVNVPPAVFARILSPETAV